MSAPAIEQPCLPLDMGWDPMTALTFGAGDRTGWTTADDWMIGHAGEHVRWVTISYDSSAPLVERDGLVTRYWGGWKIGGRAIDTDLDRLERAGLVFMLFARNVLGGGL